MTNNALHQVAVVTGQGKAAIGETFVPSLFILIIPAEFGAFFEAKDHFMKRAALRRKAGVATIFPTETVFGGAVGGNAVKRQGTAATQHHQHYQ